MPKITDTPYLTGTVNHATNNEQQRSLIFHIWLARGGDVHNGKRGSLEREESNIMLDPWKKFNPAELLLYINQNYVIIVIIIVMCVSIS